MGKPLLKSFDLVTGTTESDNRSEGVFLVETTVCRTERIVFVVTGGTGTGTSAIGSKRGSGFRQSMDAALDLEFEGVYRLAVRVKQLPAKEMEIKAWKRLLVDVKGWVEITRTYGGKKGASCLRLCAEEWIACGTHRQIAELAPISRETSKWRMAFCVSLLKQYISSRTW